MTPTILTYNSLFAGRYGIDDRRATAQIELIAGIKPDVFLMRVTGDFNSASPHDPEPEGFDALPAHQRARYLADDLKGADRRVLAHLEAAGWVDVGHVLDKAITPTVPTAGFTGTEFAPMRCDTCWRHKLWRQAPGATRSSARPRGTLPRITIPLL